MAFSAWSTTAASNASTLGIDIGEGCSAGNVNDALREMMAQLKTAVAPMAAGTVTLFYQSSAPTGWTKSTANDNKALRVVSGSGGVAGGSVAFTTAFASKAVTGTTDNHTLTTAEIPAHYHGNGVCDNTTNEFFNHGTQAASPTTVNNPSSSSASGIYEGLTETIGGGGGHSHTFTGTAINLAVQYCDIIMASRDA